MKLDVTYTSLPNRKNLVGAIWAGGAQIAQVSLEEREPTLELFPRADGEAWRLDAIPFLAAMGTVVSHLQSIEEVTDPGIPDFKGRRRKKARTARPKKKPAARKATKKKKTRRGKR